MLELKCWTMRECIKTQNVMLLRNMRSFFSLIGFVLLCAYSLSYLISLQNQLLNDSFKLVASFFLVFPFWCGCQYFLAAPFVLEGRTSTRNTGIANSSWSSTLDLWLILCLLKMKEIIYFLVLFSSIPKEERKSRHDGNVLSSFM